MRDHPGRVITVAVVGHNVTPSHHYNLAPSLHQNLTPCQHHCLTWTATYLWSFAGGNEGDFYDYNDDHDELASMLYMVSVCQPGVTKVWSLVDPPLLAFPANWHGLQMWEVPARLFPNNPILEKVNFLFLTQILIPALTNWHDLQMADARFPNLDNMSCGSRGSHLPVLSWVKSRSQYQDCNLKYLEKGCWEEGGVVKTICLTLWSAARKLLASNRFLPFLPIASFWWI